MSWGEMKPTSSTSRITSSPYMSVNTPQSQLLFCCGTLGLTDGMLFSVMCGSDGPPFLSIHSCFR